MIDSLNPNVQKNYNLNGVSYSPCIAKSRIIVYSYLQFELLLLIFPIKYFTFIAAFIFYSLLLIDLQDKELNVSICNII